MPNVVVHTIDRLTMNAATEAKIGRHRAASHNSGANNSATGPMVANSSQRSKTAKPHISASATTDSKPSMISLRDSRSRDIAASSISSGATVTIPSASDANQ